MRYIGNKTKILDEIEDLIKSKGLYKKCLKFFDAFTGTASVAHWFKNVFKIITNDNLYFSYVMSEAKLNSKEKMFECGVITFDLDGNLKLNSNLKQNQINFINYITDVVKIKDEHLTEEMKNYLLIHNKRVNLIKK